MSAATNTAPEAELDLTLEEQWVVHAAFRDYVSVASREDTELAPPTVELAILEKLEGDDRAFTLFELDRLRYECAHHAASEHAPDRDREHARSVVEKVDRQCRVAVGR